MSFTCTLRTPAYNGAHQTGFQYFTSAEPLSAQLGQGRLPEGVELALSHMTKGEKALFIVPASMMAAPQGCALPAAPGKGTVQVEIELELLAMTQVSCAYVAYPLCRCCPCHVPALTGMCAAAPLQAVRISTVRSWQGSSR